MDLEEQIYELEERLGLTHSPKETQEIGRQVALLQD